jgi:hypothetical protein
MWVRDSKIQHGPADAGHQEQGAPWGGGMMVLLCVGSFFIPLLGWILGGMNLKCPARKNQSVTLIALGVAGFFFGLLAMFE